MEKHIYLGDGVYAEKSREGITLRTESLKDHECGDRIIMEPEVLRKFLDWLGIKPPI